MAADEMRSQEVKEPHAIVMFYVLRNIPALPKEG